LIAASARRGFARCSRDAQYVRPKRGVDSQPRGGDTRSMTQSRPENEQEKTVEPNREPLFRRYQIKVKAGVRAGAVPMGRPPVF
jgi:hypothetical protein